MVCTREEWGNLRIEFNQMLRKGSLPFERTTGPLDDLTGGPQSAFDTLVVRFTFDKLAEESWKTVISERVISEKYTRLLRAPTEFRHGRVRPLLLRGPARPKQSQER